MDSAATYDLLLRARQRWSQSKLAALLKVAPRTIKRWEARECVPNGYATLALQQLLLPPDGMSHREGQDFTFIDIFAGIGGLRFGFEAVGGKCVYTSEWDEYCLKTYRANFSDEHPIVGDITKINAADVPDHDVLLAGFPCQPFSIAGVSKKKSLGHQHGFRCETQGTLFFDVARILEKRRPKAFLLENVKNLVSHDKGRTFEVIMRTLRDELGYTVFAKIVDGRSWVPQHRERILIVGFSDKVGFSWDDLRIPDKKRWPRLRDILHPEDGSEPPENPYTEGARAKVVAKYTLSTHLWKYLRAYAKKHREKGNGFGFGLVGPDDVARTLSARYFKDGSEILITRGPRKNPRRLTPRECARLMGFDHDGRRMVIPVSDTRAYKQFGNAVIVPVIEEVARIIRPHVLSLKEYEATGALQLPLSA